MDQAAATSKKFRLVVVDDHALVRQGIIETLEDDPDFEVVGQGASADDAVRVVNETKPDLIFLDVNMPGGGVAAASQIHAQNPDVLITMFSFRQDLAIVRACLAAGASGYIVKGITGCELNAVARRLLAGERWIEPELARRLALEKVAQEG